ncbi:Aste57867_25458 [Aphanomyces stellatus]|uniref:Aste57867_25458 protein n=1 Tax=Aphanomyces stellatus TaxID=120398 RepID=A0A485LU55_9STRA|nr:hypothetical protein As57867_025379 [Aphanomyces stellatus]VFU02081.1 Aste57867_25458 [Aphanomyces stellatus]
MVWTLVAVVTLFVVTTAADVQCLGDAAWFAGDILWEDLLQPYDDTAGDVAPLFATGIADAPSTTVTYTAVALTTQAAPSFTVLCLDGHVPEHLVVVRPKPSPQSVDKLPAIVTSESATAATDEPSDDPNRVVVTTNAITSRVSTMTTAMEVKIPPATSAIDSSRVVAEARSPSLVASNRAPSVDTTSPLPIASLPPPEKPVAEVDAPIAPPATPVMTMNKGTSTLMSMTTPPPPQRNNETRVPPPPLNTLQTPMSSLTQVSDTNQSSTRDPSSLSTPLPTTGPPHEVTQPPWQSNTAATLYTTLTPPPVAPMTPPADDSWTQPLVPPSPLLPSPSPTMHASDSQGADSAGRVQIDRRRATSPSPVPRLVTKQPGNKVSSLAQTTPLKPVTTSPKTPGETRPEATTTGDMDESAREARGKGQVSHTPTPAAANLTGNIHAVPSAGTADPRSSSPSLAMGTNMKASKNTSTGKASGSAAGRGGRTSTRHGVQSHDSSRQSALGSQVNHHHHDYRERMSFDGGLSRPEVREHSDKQWHASNQVSDGMGSNDTFDVWRFKDERSNRSHPFQQSDDTTTFPPRDDGRANVTRHHTRGHPGNNATNHTTSQGDWIPLKHGGNHSNVGRNQSTNNRTYPQLDNKWIAFPDNRRGNRSHESAVNQTTRHGNDRMVRVNLTVDTHPYPLSQDDRIGFPPSHNRVNATSNRSATHTNTSSSAHHAGHTNIHSSRQGHRIAFPTYNTLEHNSIDSTDAFTTPTNSTLDETTHVSTNQAIDNATYGTHQSTPDYLTSTRESTETDKLSRVDDNTIRFPAIHFDSKPSLKGGPNTTQPLGQERNTTA